MIFAETCSPLFSKEKEEGASASSLCFTYWGGGRVALTLIHKNVTRYRADTESGKVGAIRDLIAGLRFMYFLSTTFPKNYSMSGG